MEIRDGSDNERVLELIGAAVMAGAYYRAARETPDLRGWVKMARLHSARTAILADRICSEAAKDLMSLAASKRASGLPSGGWGGPASRGS